MDDVFNTGLRVLKGFVGQCLWGCASGVSSSVDYYFYGYGKTHARERESRRQKVRMNRRVLEGALRGGISSLFAAFPLLAVVPPAEVEVSSENRRR